MTHLLDQSRLQPGQLLLNLEVPCLVEVTASPNEHGVITVRVLEGGGRYFIAAREVRFPISAWVSKYDRGRQGSKANAKPILFVRGLDQDFEEQLAAFRTRLANLVAARAFPQPTTLLTQSDFARLLARIDRKIHGRYMTPLGLVVPEGAYFSVPGYEGVDREDRIPLMAAASKAGWSVMLVSPTAVTLRRK